MSLYDCFTVSDTIRKSSIAAATLTECSMSLRGQGLTGEVTSCEIPLVRQHEDEMLVSWEVMVPRGSLSYSGGRSIGGRTRHLEGFSIYTLLSLIRPGDAIVIDPYKGSPRCTLTCHGKGSFTVLREYVG